MVIEVEHLWKSFQIPHERRTTLFENIVGMIRPNHYETYTVLKDISFEVDEGECIGIIGDNGSGKSTLLKIIANILRPTKGNVRITGKMTPFLELGVGFQSDLTVQENVGVYAAIMGISKREIKNSIDEVIDFAGLTNFRDTKLKNLSSGMQVRLAFSTAIQTDPDVLLVDEVLAVGDKEFQQKCFETFSKYKREGVTILLVSHDLGAVRRFCDKTLLLRNGEKEIFSDTNSVIDEYIYRPDEARDPPTGKSDTRWGNKDIEITDVKFIDKNKKYNDNFISSDPLTVRIFYESHEKINSPVFGIIFYYQDTYCYGTTTEFKGCDTGLVYGRGYVDFIVEKLPLIAGEFEVTVAVASSDYKTQYDWHNRLYSFNVHNQMRDLGIFSVDGSWMVVQQ
ncbi:abc transporter [hydrocarbon metagenome]|jgi:lipopolysaccharide transport system ATP-binding protein|uniref:Abc transporter n=1 Tax=hydrocarbon metagenome TaxID=938273 RepID=A0A0W8F630_9ZZZZ